MDTDDDLQYLSQISACLLAYLNYLHVKELKFPAEAILENQLIPKL